ncbi:hypothetical protein MK489_06170 [Myxococcota bacterium]|nr:hypothetical protein [Myxococcota bacterium]
MSSEEFLGDRKKALEESFFAKKNQKLLDELRSKRDRASSRDSLREISGIEEDTILDCLCELGVEPDTWLAISLVPLVEVAWADGDVAPKERSAVLRAAESLGIEAGSASAQLLETWLTERPAVALMEAWGEYIVGVCASLGVAERNGLRDHILGQARSVAEAAGGILGLGQKVSDTEQRALEEIGKAFA